MNPDFPCLPVKLLFHHNYYDGPLYGVCEYLGEKLYFWNTEEIWFKNVETNPEIIASEPDPNEHYQMHRLRVYNIYRLPKELMDTIMSNNQLREKYKNSKVDSWQIEYNKEAKKLPDYWNSWDEFSKVSWKWLIGYTTEDVWDREDYNKERLKKD